MEISLDGLRFIYWLDMWDRLAICVYLELTSWKELEDFEYCHHMGELPYWAWHTKKWAKVGLTESVCWWAAFTYAWKDVGMKVQWDHWDYDRELRDELADIDAEEKTK